MLNSEVKGRESEFPPTIDSQPSTVSSQQKSEVGNQSSILPENCGLLAIHGLMLYDIDHRFTIYAPSQIDFRLAQEDELYFGF